MHSVGAECFCVLNMSTCLHCRLTGKSGLWEYLVVHAATEMSKTLEGYNMVMQN